MGTRIDPEVEKTIDDVFIPAGGWDNAPDIAEAKRYCRGLKGAFIKDGKGRSRVFDCAVRVREHGVSEQVAVAIIISEGEPQFSKVEIQDEVHSAYRSAVNPPGLRSLAAPLASEWDDAGAEDDGDWLEGGNITDEPGWPKPLAFDNKQNDAKLAEFYLAARPSKLKSCDGSLYTLTDRVWREIADEEIAAEIREADPFNALSTSKVFSIVGAIHLATYTKTRPFEWFEEPLDAPSPEDTILFANGILDLATGKLHKHTGQYFATGLPDFDYDPDAECPTFNRFVGDVLDSSFHATLQEFMGYLLTPDTSLHAILAMIGVTRGGKGTLADVVRGLIGPAHHCSRTLNDLAGDFGLEGTTDKRVIFIPDAHNTMPSLRGKVLERLKSISGDDPLSINRKNKGIVTTRVPAKIILIANKHPKFLDESGALEAREVLLDFRKSFRGKEDRDLGARLRAELPGIANWALEGLRRLRANGGKFTIGEKGKRASRELALSQSPALRFTTEYLTVTGDPEDFAPLDPSFAAYSQWANFEEDLGSHEKRNRDDFRGDVMAALAARGVTYGRRRWRDPETFKGQYGTSPRVWGFIGAMLKPNALDIWRAKI